ncbi:DUF58 domain-containing protein [Rhodanobacter hydrolyticus]|uniref:DUF58 domain-containing protein n=1 Tax=Rhodanobacter hydrolyticus TaxID=2250595 RepID=A0ABW8J801_9GAMM
MSAVLPNRADGDGRVRVSLAELVALGTRIGRAKLSPADSRAARSGQHSSRLYGRGMDYAESRIYQAGDDVRRLDWRLTARSGRLHTKLFQEEREGRLLILLDTHSSMRFGTRVRFKSVQAARAAAFAAWLAVRAGERVGMLAFGEQDRLLRPQGSARGALAACGALAEWDAMPSMARSEPLSTALLRARRLQHGASRVLLISDGFSADDETRQHLFELKARAEVGVLVVADALEREPPPPGRYPLEHGGERRDVVLFGERQRREFQQALGTGPARLETLAHGAGVRCRVIDTRNDPLAAVSELLGATGVCR